MKYLIDFDEDVRKVFQHFSPLRKQKIKECLREISLNPFVGKALQENLTGFYSYRAGHFRILYIIDKEERIVRLMAIGFRGNVYKELEKHILGEE